MDKSELEKHAEELCVYNDQIHRDCFVNGYVTGSLGREQKIKDLEKELEAERKLNAEIKARFVKCNTCTEEMKDKCLMFSENLCEGERCEELVDLMALIDKNNKDDNVLRVVIRDRDNRGAVMGIVTLVENTAVEFWKEFSDYKNECPDSWYWEGFLDYLIDHNWHYDWESGNVSDIEI